MGYTFEQLQQMGAKPVVNTASLEPKKYTFEELQGLGAKPIENPFKFDVVETQQAKIERLRADADLAMKKAKKANSFLNTYVRGTMDAILPGTTNLGDTLGGLATDKFVRKNYETATSNLKDSNLKLQQTIYKLEKEGKDTTKLKQLYNSNVDTLDSLEKQYKDATEGVEGKSVGNVAGEVGLTGLSVLTAGTYGKAKSPVPSVIENARNILPKSTGLFTKEGAKNVVMGATKATPVGYGFDVTMGMAGMRGEDREGVKSLIPGVGTAIAPVLGAAIPALTEGTQSVKNVFNKELRKNNTVSKVADEIFNVQNNYSKTRKFNNALVDEGKASRERVASSGVLQGSVNTDGSISTKTKGGAIDQYKKATVDGGEGVVYDILKEEGATAEITKIENNLLKNIQESNLTLDEVESATNNVEKIIKQFKQKYPSGKVPLADLQLEKIKTTQNIDYTNTSSKIRQKAIGRAYKELVEDNSALNIKEINSKVLQPYYDDLTLLENLDGRKVKGGKLGKYFSQISGNIIGGIAGNAVGGPAGSAIGTIVGGELGGRIRGSIMSKSFSGNIDSVLKKSPILEKAQNYKKSLPAKISGVDYNVKPSGNKYAPIELPAQLNRSGNRNQRYNPTAIDNSIAPNNAISTTLPQKVEKAIVKKDLTSLKEYNAEITKQIDKFRKEAGLMASNEGAGVRQYVSDQTGGEDRIYNSFKLSRAKSDMHKRAESAKKYAQEMMYENDPDFRELVDKRDQLLNNKIDTSTNEIDVKAIFDDISREESKINEANKELGAFNEVKNVETKSSQENATTTKKEIELPKKSFVKKIVETYKNNPERGAIANPLSNVSKKIISEGEQKPTLQLKRDVTVTTLTGEKAVIDAGEVLKAYEQGGKALLKDGREYIVSKSQYENIKNNSLKSEAKPFAPELKTTEETTLGAGSSKPIEWTPSETGVKTTYNGKTYITSKEGTKYLTREVGGRGALGTGEGHRTLEKAKSFAEDYIKESSNKKTKYSQYQLPEGKNYKEILIKAPKKGENPLAYSKETTFKSSHWDEPNVISHLRLNERTYKGKKVTFMEELQSDWARELRNTEKLISEGDNSTVVAKRLKNLQNPLLKNWQELSIKRALKEAVDNGSDYFAWINGDQTSARYNLATHVNNVEWFDPSTAKVGRKSIVLEPKSGGKRLEFEIGKDGIINQVEDGVPLEWKGKKLDEVIGKGLADKIMEKESGTLSGEGLKFGGEWANNLYDKQVKNIVEDLTGAKVEVIDMGLPIDKGTLSGHWYKNGKELIGNELFNLKVGDKIGRGTSVDYKILSIKDGKIKAEPIRVKGFIPSLEAKTETFDISTKKSAGQQAIKITPEIRAMVKGEAPKLLPTKKPPIKELPKKR